MQSPAYVATSLARVVFLRGSPERIHYSRPLFIVALLLAVAASAGAQALYHQDHVIFVILRVFAELTLFMLAMVLLTAQLVRVRLVRLMLVLVMISLAADLLLMIAAFAPSISHPWLGYGLYAVAFYGATNCIRWALSAPLWTSAVLVGGYVVCVLALTEVFRWTYSLYAGA